MNTRHFQVDFLSLAATFALVALLCLSHADAQTTAAGAIATRSGWFKVIRPNEMWVSWGIDTTVSPHRLYYAMNVTAGVYGGVGWSPKEMDGPMVVCYAPSTSALATLTKHCYDYDGAGYDVETPSNPNRHTLHLAEQIGTSNMIHYLFSLTVTEATVKPNEKIRMIFAIGPWEDEDGGEPGTHGMGTDAMWITKADHYAYTMAELKTDLTKTYVAFGIVAAVIVVIWAIGAVATHAGVVLSPRGVLAVQVFYCVVFFAGFLVIVIVSTLDYTRDAAVAPFGRGLGQGAIYLFALILLPIAKHASLFRFFGVSYERAIIYHIILGFSVFVVLTVHFILMLTTYGDFAWLLSWHKHLVQPNLPGFLSWLFLVLMTLTSLPPVRRRFFAVFRYTHYLFVLVIVFGIFHWPPMGYFVALGCAVWVLDFALRIVTQVKTKPEVFAASYDEGAKLISLRINCAGGMDFEAGQYVFLAFRGCGPLTHPFTVADYNANTKEMVILIKVLGGWTAQLAELVQKDGAKGSVITLFNGPYGSLQVPLQKTDHAVLVSGGIGVTPMLSLLTAIAHGRDGGEHVTSATFVWSVRDLGLIDACLPFLKSALDAINTLHVSTSPESTTSVAPKRKIDLKIHLTGEHDSNTDFSSYPFEINSGRPNLDSIVAEVKGNASSDETVACFCCGPSQLMSGVANVAQVHGTLLHSETFEF